MTDFFKHVPLELGANIEYRIKIRKRAQADVGFQKAMMAASKEDICFWLGTFCFLYEPRPKMINGRLASTTVPFVPWPHQLPVIREIRQHLGFRDISAEKARAEGCSWLLDYFAIHDWLFIEGAKVGLVSNNEKKTDDPGNLDSLMAKIDWALERMPRWMTGVKDVDWTRNKSDHSFVHLRMMSQINGFAATGDAGRAGRYRWFGVDELGFWDRPVDRRFLESIRGSTESRLIVSTPNGSEGAYYDFMHTPSNAIKVVLDWKDNPTKNRGMYRYIDGAPVAIDPVNNPLPEHYNPPSQAVLDMLSRLKLKGFTLEGRDRSEWYDTYCDRADSTPNSVAKELDRDYGGSTYRIFQADFYDKVSKTIKPPLIRGELSYKSETLEPEFDRTENAPCLLWTSLDARNRPQRHPYAIASDIGTGLGGSYTSNSVVTVIDLVTGEQVFEFASNTIPIPDFADFCIAVAKWFWNGYLAWEIDGPGAAFTRQVIARGYGNCYERTQQYKRSRKTTKELGWRTRGNKEQLFMELIRSVKAGELKVHSNGMVQESQQYIRLDGKIEHVGSIRTEDDSSTGESHGDRVIALAVCLQAMRDRPLDRSELPEGTPENPPQNTMAARQKAYEDSLKEEGEVWDDRTNWDLSQRASMVGRSRNR